MSNPTDWNAPMVQLGTLVTEKFTGQQGAATMLDINSAGQRTYLFQPRALNPETKQPVEAFWITADRLVGGKLVPLPRKMPYEAVGSEVTDTVTGFTGALCGFSFYTTGCLHLAIQPKGAQKSGEKIGIACFDVTRVYGKQLKKLSEAEIKKTQAETPSPCARPPGRIA